MDTNLASKVYKQFDTMLNNKRPEVEDKTGGLLNRTMPKKDNQDMKLGNDVNKRVADYIAYIRNKRESLKNGRS